MTAGRRRLYWLAVTLGAALVAILLDGLIVAGSPTFWHYPARHFCQSVSTGMTFDEVLRRASGVREPPAMQFVQRELIVDGDESACIVVFDAANVVVSTRESDLPVSK